MKLNLFLLASVFAAFYLCEAGPLRLQKRAVFYIANETACVVDNIVYTSGDPIPTDDPCEACKCRPPGFACVLKECRPKPGCRAVRQVGQCCPEYVCGCEHNGRMYQDGEEIRDAKNPCYICHCQGSAIACAFLDCLFRGDCPPVYVPGECCPVYSNCTTRDAPESIPFKENNPVPSLNLLPGLNDDSVFVPEKIPTTPKVAAPTEIVTNPPTQSSVATDKSTEENIPDVKASGELQTEIPSSISVENKPAVVPGENIFVEKAPPSDTEKDSSSQEDKVEKSDKNVLLHSETEIQKDENVETTTLKLPILSLEVAKDQEIKITSETEAGQKAGVPENQSESVTSLEDYLTTEKTVKNSAANNSKSLKLSEGGNAAENEKSVKEIEIKTETPVQVDIKTTEIPAQPSTESSSKINPITSSGTEPQSAENIAEESQINPQSSFYSNNEKIKSETAETVTIVVHVKDKTKTTTETNLDIEQGTSESVTNATKENLLKSKDELKSLEPAKDDKTTLDELSSEVFISSTEPNKKELSTLSPLTVKKPKDEESGSVKKDLSSETPENAVSNYETTSLKIDEVSPTVTTAQGQHVTESTSAEARADEEEIKEEIKKEKTEDLKVLVTKDENPKVSETTISETGPKTDKVEENQTNYEGTTEISAAEAREEEEIKKEKTEDLKVLETKEGKPKVSETTISETGLKTDKGEENQTKYEGTTEISAAEESATKIKTEVREDENKSDDKGDITSTTKGQETAPEEKVASTTSQTETKVEARSEETESKEIVIKNIEKTTTVNTQEQKDGVTTELVNQDIKTLAQTETPKIDSE